MSHESPHVMDLSSQTGKTGLQNDAGKISQKHLPWNNSLRGGITYGVLVICAISVSISMIIMLVFISRGLKMNLQKQATQLVTLAATQIDGNALGNLRTPDQMAGLDYSNVQNTLETIQSKIPDTVFVRILRLTSGAVTFVVEVNGNTQQSRQIGDRYQELPGTIVQRLQRITGPFTADGVITDNSGQYWSAFAPVYSSQGELSGVLEIGVRADSYLLLQQRMILLFISVVIIALLTVGALGLWLSRRMVNQIIYWGAWINSIAESKEIVLETPIKLTELERITESITTAFAGFQTRQTQLKNQLHEQNQEFMRRAGIIQTASQIAANASRIQDPDQLMPQVIIGIRENFNLETARYYEGNDELVTLAYEVNRSNDNRTSDASNLGIKFRKGDGLIGRAMVERSFQLGSEEIQTSSSELKASELIIPLLFNDMFLGVIELGTINPEFFNEFTIDVLQAMCEQISVAIRNAKVYHETRQAFDTLQNSYEKITRSAWSGYLRNSGDIGYNAGNSGLIQVNQLPVKNHLPAVGEPYRLDGRLLTMPVRVRGEIFGFIQASQPEGILAWTSDEIELLQTLVDQLGVALDNARLYSATQRSAERERIQSEITTSVRASSNIDVIMQTAVRQLTEALGAPKGVIRLNFSGTDERVKQEPEDNHS